jgi:hypothetical protein
MLGHLVREPRGSGGFGYDPIFVALGEKLTNAELPPERKDEISHRGKALRSLLPYIATAVYEQERPPAAPAPPAEPTVTTGPIPPVPLVPRGYAPGPPPPPSPGYDPRRNG